MKITCRDHTFLIENLPHQSLQLAINEQLIPLQKIETAFVLSIDTLLDIFKKRIILLNSSMNPEHRSRSNIFRSH